MKENQFKKVVSGSGDPDTTTGRTNQKLSELAKTYQFKENKSLKFT